MTVPSELDQFCESGRYAATQRAAIAVLPPTAPPRRAVGGNDSLHTLQATMTAEPR